MSNNLTESERQTIQSAKKTKRAQLVRSASLEQIKKFNTFICSQNYHYILPATFAWLKTSRGLIQEQIERSIQLIKHLFFTSFFYKTVRAFCRFVKMGADFAYHGAFGVYLYAAQKFFAALVYLTVSAIFVQLAACLYVLSSCPLLPNGLVFLVTCVYVISHINLKCLNYFLVKTEREAASDKLLHLDQQHQYQKPVRLSRRDILGKRTISNFNFF